jgi:hypothetical protein
VQIDPEAQRKARARDERVPLGALHSVTQRHRCIRFLRVTVRATADGCRLCSTGLGQRAAERRLHARAAAAAAGAEERAHRVVASIPHGTYPTRAGAVLHGRTCSCPPAHDTACHCVRERTGSLVACCLWQVVCRLLRVGAHVACFRLRAPVDAIARVGSMCATGARTPTDVGRLSAVPVPTWPHVRHSVVQSHRRVLQMILEHDDEQLDMLHESVRRAAVALALPYVACTHPHCFGRGCARRTAAQARAAPLLKRALSVLCGCVCGFVWLHIGSVFGFSGPQWAGPHAHESVLTLRVPRTVHAPCTTLPYQTTQYHTLQHHALPCTTMHCITCQAVPGSARQCQAVPGSARQCQAVPGSARQCRAVP